MEEAGWLGLAGFLLLSLWLVLVPGFTFVEAFILPLLATDAPKFVEGFLGIFTGSAGETNLGALPTLWTLMGVLYMLGRLLFGIATFRAGILSRWAAGLLAVGAVSVLGRRCSRTRSRYSRCRWGSLWPGWAMRSGPNGEREPRNPSSEGHAQLSQPAFE